MESKFFGFKLNTVLLFLLIILVLGAIFVMFQIKGVNLNDWMPYLGITSPEEPLPSEDMRYKDGILGNKDDLISSSILPYTKVHGILSYRGIIEGGYFFEGNILINILDYNKKVLKASNAVAKSDWMTSGPVDFEGNIDFTGLPKGPAYFEIHNDNASALPENDKSILIPIVVE